MALTRPRFGQLNTSVVAESDPITVLHQGATAANVDVGFLFNRANGLVPNVALYWSESAQSIVTAYTSSSGVTDANISVTSYANLTVGNVLLVTGSILNVQGNINANTLGTHYGNIVSTTANVAGDAYVGGNLTVVGNVIAQNREIVTSVEIVSGNLVANSGTASTNTTTGALVVQGGAGISGNLFAGGYVYATPTSVTDVAGGTYNTAIAIPGSNWGIYANIGQTGTYYLRQVIGKDTSNNIIVGHVGTTALNANVNVWPGSGGTGYFNVINPLSTNPVFSVNTTANTVVVANSQASTSNTTGALIVAGGVGVTGNINVNGNVYATGTNSRLGMTWANSVSSAYSIFNAATNSVDLIFG
jgi:hypothetical protein